MNLLVMKQIQQKVFMFNNRQTCKFRRPPLPDKCWPELDDLSWPVCSMWAFASPLPMAASIAGSSCSLPGSDTGDCEPLNLLGSDCSSLRSPDDLSCFLLFGCPPSCKLLWRSSACSELDCGIRVWHMPALVQIFRDDSCNDFGDGTLGHP